MSIKQDYARPTFCRCKFCLAHWGAVAIKLPYDELAKQFLAVNYDPARVTIDWVEPVLEKDLTPEAAEK